MSLPIITEITDRNHFMELLKANPGLFLIKFGAKWCGPCKTIDNGVKFYFEKMPSNVQCAIIDIDKCPDVYSFLRSKRIVNGVPVILCYYQGNKTHVPDDIVIGADKKQIIDFFERCNNVDI
jgi:thioredoxin-like negative regulator of GroEL